jgi:hypothetical protein
MKITEIILNSRCHDLNEMLVSWANRNTGIFAVEIRDPKENWIIDVVNEEDCFYYQQISPGSKLLVCYSTLAWYYANNGARMRIWKIRQLCYTTAILGSATYEFG